jgi:hypothetical protein
VMLTGTGREPPSEAAVKFIPVLAVAGAKEAAEKLGFVAVLAVAGAKAHLIFKRLRHD